MVIASVVETVAAEHHADVFVLDALELAAGELCALGEYCTVSRHKLPSRSNALKGHALST
jgi:hypothetical protein